MCRSNDINLCLSWAASEDTLGFMHTLPSSLQHNCSFRCYSSTYPTSEMLSEMHHTEPLLLVLVAVSLFSQMANKKKKFFRIQITILWSQRKYRWDGDGAVSRLVNRGDLINEVIHHQFPWQGAAETNSPLFWHGGGVPCPWWLIWINRAALTLMLIVD